MIVVAEATFSNISSCLTIRSKAFNLIGCWSFQFPARRQLRPVQALPEVGGVHAPGDER